VHLLQLRVAAQLAYQLVERDVGGEELPHRTLGAVHRHLVHQLLQPREVRLGNSRNQEPDRHHLERLADLVRVDQLLQGQRPDLGPAPRPHRDQPFGRQAAHGFPDGAAAYRKLLGQCHLGQFGAGLEVISQDLVAQVLIDPLRQRQVVERHRH